LEVCFDFYLEEADSMYSTQQSEKIAAAKKSRGPLEIQDYSTTPAGVSNE
jgi:hypothetical protein